MASKEEIESRIKEQRTAEANKKGLMGQGGKIGLVLRMLGSPIVGQVEDAAFLDLEGRIEDPSGNPIMDIPVADLDGVNRPYGSEWGGIAESVPVSTRTIGMHFDGLSRSMHLEIIYKDEESELSVYHRGRLVYREVQGDLVCYVPADEWEDWVSSLFKTAKKMHRDSKEDEFKEKVKEARDSKESWLRHIAARWGIT
jgi:hypothetical protein